MRARVAATAALVALLALGGCSQATTAESRGRDSARTAVEEALHSVAYDRFEAIDFAARSVSVLFTTTSLRLIGIAEREATTLGDTFGTLDLLVPEAVAVDDSDVESTVGPFCFRVGFNYYGADVDGDVVVAKLIDCPEDPVEVVPPPDETVYPVIAENAREAIREVLTQVASSGETPSTAAIAERISAMLTPPTSEFQSLAEPDVAQDAGKIGVAIAAGNACVLVSLVDETVTDVYPPNILLQAGELGCSGSTAIADPERLRSPH